MTKSHRCIIILISTTDTSLNYLYCHLLSRFRRHLSTLCPPLLTAAPSPRPLQLPPFPLQSLHPNCIWHLYLPSLPSQACLLGQQLLSPLQCRSCQPFSDQGWDPWLMSILPILLCRICYVCCWTYVVGGKGSLHLLPCRNFPLHHP